MPFIIFAKSKNKSEENGGYKSGGLDSGGSFIELQYSLYYLSLLENGGSSIQPY